MKKFFVAMLLTALLSGTVHAEELSGAAALTVLKFFGSNDFDEATLIRLMKTNPHTGTNIATW